MGVGPLRILTVDDEPLVVEVFQVVLESFGHTATGVTQPSEALGALERGFRVDLVLTDYRMPGMNGVRLAETIRARWPQVGLGLISGVRNLEEPTLRVFDLVLPKPLDVSRLRVELDRFAAARPRQDADGEMSAG